jgi:hypothetical protein
MKFLGPDDIAPETNKKFDLIYKRIGKIEQNLLQYDYVIQQCKGMTLKTITDKIEASSNLQDMRLK